MVLRRQVYAPEKIIKALIGSVSVKHRVNRQVSLTGSSPVCTIRVKTKAKASVRALPIDLQVGGV